MTKIVFGQFLEFSVPTPDIQDSLNFYVNLGFSELPTGDIRNYHYGVVTDGRIAIGLHADERDESSLSFVNPDVASYLQRVMPTGEELIFSRLGSETFHEIGIHTPDAHSLIMMEARTFSRTNLSELPVPVVGRCLEITLGCQDVSNASSYWADAGFVVNNNPSGESVDEPIEVLAPGLRLGLRSTLRSGQMALRFAPENLQLSLERLTRRNVTVRPSGTGHWLTAPEGTRLDLVDAGNGEP